MSWIFRGFVQERLGSLGFVMPEEALALSEATYSVSNTGRVSQQPKFLSAQSAIRLACRIVERAEPSANFNFENNAWQQFVEGLKVRNRITHPKSASDFEIDETELNACTEGFYRAMNTIVSGMQITISVAQDEALQSRKLLEDLNAGDPQAWADYFAAEAVLNKGA